MVKLKDIHTWLRSSSFSAEKHQKMSCPSCARRPFETTNEEMREKERERDDEEASKKMFKNGKRRL
jgi:4-hydroxy-3-methylbut-2-en-1-yl diphosphate synthase IspG/GcpE